MNVYNCLNLSGGCLGTQVAPNEKIAIEKQNFSVPKSEPYRMARSAEKIGEMVRWQPIETAPDYQSILITDGKEIAVASYEQSEVHQGEYEWLLYTRLDREVVALYGNPPTHWAFLPSLPNFE